MKEATLTFKQVEPALHKWANHFHWLTEGQFEVWELINSVWAYGNTRKLLQSQIKFASNAIRWDMIDYIRTETGSRRQLRWSKKGKNYPKFHHISALDSNTEGGYRRGLFFVETFPAPAEDLEQKELILFLVNHPSLSSRERLVMNLLYIKGDNQTEASRVCGYSANSICKWHQNLLERLKSLDLTRIA